MGYLAARLGQNQPSQAEKDALISRIKAAILSRCRPQAIYVFGSILGNEFTHASDIDVAVILRDSAALAVARASLFRGPPLVDVPYDLLLYDVDTFASRAAAGGICQVITDSGKKVYDEGAEV